MIGIRTEFSWAVSVVYRILKAEAEAYQDKEKEIRRKKNILYQIDEGKATESAAKLKEKLDEATQKLADERKKLQENELRFSSVKETHDLTTREHNAVDSELQKANMDFGAFERRDVKMQEDMKHNSAQIKKQQASR